MLHSYFPELHPNKVYRLKKKNLYISDFFMQEKSSSPAVTHSYTYLCVLKPEGTINRLASTMR